MKIRVVSSKEEINNLGSNEEMIHLAFRPSNTDIFNLITKCPDVKALHIPSSYIRTISKSTQMFLEMKGIALIEGDVWGHRKDINEYSEVSESVYERFDQYRANGLSDEEIAAKMERELHMSTDLIKFLLKNRK
ncbi:Protein of unknown function [Methanolobus vulcani]|jgi:hypothetical protein|uniref:DUF1699 family protein n=1 Tax=Methanolobus vulcani TaxID=38026 RepID=A0A7Z7FC27_9EURY|nr:DUF1699 family protein [Methanolobus vulcani]MDK2826590.1 hypothetical protein [Methanolobus sp.]MDK2947852.1 hypothetical protein [Methanolobus sp.]SDF48896.1 Protein of unknown function [Methanolobus vulcani]